jgi:hypothetical protein
MTVCISAGGTNFSLRGQYPVLDPHRTAGPGPFRYGYELAADGIVISIKRNPTLDSCEMRLTLKTTLAEGKDILAWNFFRNDLVDRIGSPGLGLPSSMKIRRTVSMGLPCGQGADTVVLRRRDAAFGNWTAWYWFSPPDFWDFWGGCNVTFDWFSDTNRGLWADQTPAPTYPIVKLPDFTLMSDGSGNLSLVFGGTDFAVSASILSSSGVWPVSASDAIPSRPLPRIPADFTLVREWMAPADLYVVYGGARFRIPDLATFMSLRFNMSEVRTLPPGGTGKLKKMPINGTLLREEHSSKVYLADHGKLRQVAKAAIEGRCISSRNVRVVPDKGLAALSKGPNLGPP